MKSAKWENIFKGWRELKTPPGHTYSYNNNYGINLATGGGNKTSLLTFEKSVVGKYQYILAIFTANTFKIEKGIKKTETYLSEFTFNDSNGSTIGADKYENIYASSRYIENDLNRYNINGLLPGSVQEWSSPMLSFNPIYATPDGNIARYNADLKNTIIIENVGKTDINGQWVFIKFKEKVDIAGVKIKAGGNSSSLYPVNVRIFATNDTFIKEPTHAFESVNANATFNTFKNSDEKYHELKYVEWTNPALVYVRDGSKEIGWNIFRKYLLMETKNKTRQDPDDDDTIFIHDSTPYYSLLTITDNTDTLNDSSEPLFFGPVGDTPNRGVHLFKNQFFKNTFSNYLESFLVEFRKLPDWNASHDIKKTNIFNGVEILSEGDIYDEADDLWEDENTTKQGVIVNDIDNVKLMIINDSNNTIIDKYNLYNRELFTYYDNNIKAVKALEVIVKEATELTICVEDLKREYNTMIRKQTSEFYNKQTSILNIKKDSDKINNLINHIKFLKTYNRVINPSTNYLTQRISNFVPQLQYEYIAGWEDIPGFASDPTLYQPDVIGKKAVDLFTENLTNKNGFYWDPTPSYDGFSNLVLEKDVETQRKESFTGGNWRAASNDTGRTYLPIVKKYVPLAGIWSVY